MPITFPGEILVTGASGFIGRALVGHLCSLGHSVAALSRKIDNAFPVGVRSIRGDLLAQSSLPPDLFRGVKAVFHCAGEINDPSNMRRLHVDGTARLLDLACREAVGNSSRPIRWVQLSSVGAYGPGGRSGLERVVTEGSVENARGEYEITKTEADRLLLKASADGKIALTILRPSNVFGPGMPNRSLPGLLSAIRRGLFFYIGSREAISTYVHVEDVVRALAACVGSPIAIGKVYNLSNDCLLSDLVNAVADSCGQNRPRLVIPEFIVRGLAMAFKGRPSWPLTNSRIDALVSRTRYPADLIRRELGFEFSRPVPVSALELLD